MTQQTGELDTKAQKMDWNIEGTFSDAFFMATQGRNDIRREKIKAFLSQQRKEILGEVKGIEQWRCTDMGNNSEDYVVVRKSAIERLFTNLSEEKE